MTDGVSREVRLPRPGQSLRGRVEGGRGRHQGRQGGQHRVPGRQHLDTNIALLQPNCTASLVLLVLFLHCQCTMASNEDKTTSKYARYWLLGASWESCVMWFHGLCVKPNSALLGMTSGDHNFIT